MTGNPDVRYVEVNGARCRIWSRGDGPAVVVLAGLGGYPRWSPFLDLLSAHYHVIVPSMPGHPGSFGHERLDSQLDWLVAMRDLLERAGGTTAPLVGISVGGALAADIAALWNSDSSALVLVAPLGVHDPGDPIADVWAQRAESLPSLFCAAPERYLAHRAIPEGADPTEWEMDLVRAATAEARLLWPLCDTGLLGRLPRLRARTLLLWGEQDRVIAPTYAERFANAIAGPTTQHIVPGAGHLADLDAPETIAKHIRSFLDAEAC